MPAGPVWSAAGALEAPGVFGVILLSFPSRIDFSMVYIVVIAGCGPISRSVDGVAPIPVVRSFPLRCITLFFYLKKNQ